MRARLVLTPLLLVACAAFACGTTRGGTAGAPESGTDSGADLDGDSMDAASDVASDDAGPVDVGGIFVVSNSLTVDGGPPAAHKGGAFFTLGTGVDPGTTSKAVGPCVVETLGDGTTPDPTNRSAGTLHITGGATNVDLLPGATKAYADVNGSGALWSGGETLTVAADGKDVPAFTTFLVAPSTLTMTAPALPSASSTLGVTRSAPFSATWTGASSGSVVLFFSATAAVQAFTATCTFKASDGQGVIPAAAFADFPATLGFFTFFVKQEAVASPKGWAVRFTASRSIVDPAGVRATGDATFN